jgi:phage shock protein A
VFQTLRVLARATFASAEEELESRNATAILAQHLREAKAELNGAYGRIATLMAQRKEEARRVEKLDALGAKRMEEGRRAMEMGEEALAEEIADDMAALEAEREASAKHGAELDAHIARLRRGTEAADRQIRALAADLRAAQSAERVRRIDGAATCGRPSPTESALTRAHDVAERLKDRDVQRADLAEAMATLREETELDDRLKKAGVAEKTKGRSAEILESFKAKGDDK